MKRIDRYLVRDMLLPLTAGTLILAALFMLNELIWILKQQVSQVPPLAIFQLALFAMPKWIVYTLPVGLAFGTSMVVSRLVRESELTALRAAGVPIRRVVAPIMLVGLLFTFLSFYMVEQVVPWSQARQKKLGIDFLTMAGQREFLNDLPVMLGKYLVKVHELHRIETGEYDLKDVFLHEEDTSGTHRFVLAKTGKYKDGIWTFRNALIYQIQDDQLLAVKTDDLTIYQKLDLSNFAQVPLPEEKSIAKLFHDIDEGRKIGRDVRSDEANLHEKFVMPLTCVVFAVASAYTCVRAARFGAFAGTFLSFVLAWLFFNLHVIAKEIVAAHGWLPAAVALYAPLVILLLITAALVWGSE